jgi:hypothetical protein
MLTHHAYYVEGPLELFSAYQQAIRAANHIEPHDPGFTARFYEKFGIEEARSLLELASLRVGEGRSVFYIGVSSMTSEAQQALLKLLEEPQLGVHFIFLLPHGTLLPTLRSRFLPYPEQLPQQYVSKSAKEFLALPYAKRSAWITSFIESHEDEDPREHVRALFAGLEQVLQKDAAKNITVRQSLEDIAHFRQYLFDRASSLKMLLEHLAARLPTIS